MSAYTASVNRGDYCVAKAGLGMMTKLYAARLAEHGITVFEVRPGIIATDMTGAVQEKYDRLILADGITPIRRWGSPRTWAGRWWRSRRTCCRSPPARSSTWTAASTCGLCSRAGAQQLVHGLDVGRGGAGGAPVHDAGRDEEDLERGETDGEVRRRREAARERGEDRPDEPVAGGPADAVDEVAEASRRCPGARAGSRPR